METKSGMSLFAYSYHYINPLYAYDVQYTYAHENVCICKGMYRYPIVHIKVCKMLANPHKHFVWAISWAAHGNL